MEVVWARGPVSVADVVATLEPDVPLAYNSVQTMMKILEQKGYLRHREQGRAFVYSAIVDRATAARAALTYVTQRFFGGSAERVALKVIEDARLSGPQLERIRRAIKQA